MNPSTHDQDDPLYAPGTVILEDVRRSDKVILQPRPTSDPNDPLNWSSWRKSLNFGLVCFYVLMTFVQLDIGFTAWEQYQEELGFTIPLMNGAAAVNYAGLGVGCIFFVPLVNKYGRRPMYIFSTTLQLASCIWFAKTQTAGDMWGSNLISGLGGAISETIVQMTIVDLFFVHHHAAMNAWYMFATGAGAYLGPAASGFIVDSQGWRWMWWWCVILFGVNLVLIIFFFEESKYMPVLQGQVEETRQPVLNELQEASPDKATSAIPTGDLKHEENSDRTSIHIDHSIPKKTYWQRLALVTPTDGAIWSDVHHPLVLLFRFPAIAYAAVTYGSLLAWFAILISIQTTYLFEPPYNFSATGVGLMNFAPFIGAIPGVIVAGYLNDKSIVWLSKRNRGIYEPEMRLWLALPSAVIGPAGILIFGIGLYRNAPWQVLAVGLGIFSFAFMVAGDISLSYAMDSYQDVIGNALVGVVFTRNAFSVVVLFALTPWVEGMGLQNLHVLVAMLCFATLLIPVPLLIWGKKARISSAARYKEMALLQPTRRYF